VPAQPKAPEVAVRASPGEAKPDEGPSAQVAAVDAAGGQTAQQQKDNAKVYVIRRGDTLWAIAKRYLGNGLLYTSIFQDNREVISNPNLIHPKQELTVPAP
jgi:nucleoid-associated protein YgaU